MRFPQLVRQTREKLSALLREHDRKAVDWVDAQRQERRGAPSAVVVGETNRGKSSLVNALLNSPGLSPVDAGLATTSYLVFRHADAWASRAWYSGAADPVELPLDELGRTVTTAEDLPPRWVEVDAPVPLLANLSIVDTPGVGGLNSMHGELAAEAAAGATALLFVLDSSAPLTKGELDFLCSAGSRIESVIFVLTKIDQFRGWRQVLDADRRLLAEHAPRFAKSAFYAVSSRMFEMAAKAPSPDAATMLRERSGIAGLQSAVQELVAGRSLMLGEANALRALSTICAEVIVKLEGAIAALSTGDERIVTLRDRREQLMAERKSSTRSWQVKLRSEVQRARLECGHEVSKQIREAQAWFRQAIDVADRDALAVLPQQLDAALRVVSGRISAVLADRLGRAADNALAELFSADELSVIRAQFARAGQPPVVLRPPEKRTSTPEDKLLVFMGLSGGMGVGRIAAMPLAAMPLAGIGAAAMGWFVLPVTITLGLGAGWWMARTRRHTADKQHMKQWLSDALADARSTLDQVVSEQLIEAETQLALALDEALAARIEAIDEELRDVDKSLKLDAAERSRRQQEMARKLTEVRAGRSQAEQLLGAIRELRDNR